MLAEELILLASFIVIFWIVVVVMAMASKRVAPSPKAWSDQDEEHAEDQGC